MLDILRLARPMGLRLFARNAVAQRIQTRAPKATFFSSPPYLAHWLAANGGSNTGKGSADLFSLAAKEAQLAPPVAEPETRLCSPRLLASGGTDNLSSPVRHFSFVAITFADLRYAAILRLYPTPLLLNDELFDELLISCSKQKKCSCFFLRGRESCRLQSSLFVSFQRTV